jgi:hypothetical protein
MVKSLREVLFCISLPIPENAFFGDIVRLKLFENSVFFLLMFGFLLIYLDLVGHKALVIRIIAILIPHSSSY